MFLKEDINIKNITKKVLYHSGLANFLLGRNRRKLLILSHHRIVPPGGKFTYLGMSQDIFEQQVVFLKRYFKIVPFNEGIERFRAGSIKEPLLILTFDDGYRDNYLYAFPVLKKYDITGTIFVTADFLGTKKRFWWDIVADMIIGSSSLDAGLKERIEMVEDINKSLKTMVAGEMEHEIEKIEKKFGSVRNNDKEREILNWKEIKEMSSYGIDFGSHTLTHPNLTLLNQNELAREVSKSKQILEEALKKEIRGFAYPHGLYNEDVKKAVRKSNYSYARSMLNGFNNINEDMFALKCISGFSNTLKDLIVRLSYRGL